MSEKKLIEFASMPDIEEQLRDRMEALTQAQERQGTAEDRIQRLECQLEEKTADVFKLSQRLKMNEEHNQRLSATVDKLLSGKRLFINYVTQIGGVGGCGVGHRVVTERERGYEIPKIMLRNYPLRPNLYSRL